MKDIFIVGCGSFVGGAGRFIISRALSSTVSIANLPVGTFAVNALGCFLIGILASYLEVHHPSNSSIKHLTIVGILGGFTTFSAFSQESVALIRSGHPGSAAIYVGASILICLFATWIGIKIFNSL